MNRTICSFALLVLVVFVSVLGDHIEESENEVVYRVTRGIHGSRKGNSGECRYKKSAWEECDMTTNTEKRTLTLKRGDSSCESTKELTRKCKKACRYDKGEWQDCNGISNTRSRTDNLKPKSDSSCQPTRTITKKCKKVCKYDRQADWTRCEGGKKTKVMRLIQGDPGTCESSRTVNKPCRAGSRKPMKSFKPSEEDYEDEERR